MAEQVIYLEAVDDRVSIRDRLQHVEAARVLVVLPPLDEPIRDRLGLVLLQRQAARQNLEIGLVTINPDLSAEARDLGIPVFPSVEIGQNRRWRWPWRGAQPEQLVRPPQPPDAADLREAYRRGRPQTATARWLNRLAGLALFIFVIVTLGISVIYVLPGATITLHPAMETLTVTTAVVGDPAATASDYQAGVVPARVIRVEVTWRGAVATTGSADVPDVPATGAVVFINQQAGPVVVPAGTIVRTSAGTTIRFRTTRQIEVPGAVGATAEAPIVAVDPGPWGNVDANLINRIEGGVSLQLNVRNLSPTTGGSVRQDKAVTQADLDRLRGQVLQQLYQLAKAEMANWMTESEFLVEETLALFTVMEEDYNRYVGEQADSVELRIKALIQGYVVDENEGYGVVYTALAAATPPEHRLLPGSIATPRRGDVLNVDENGRATFLMQGQARAAAVIDQGAVLESVRGQEIGFATRWILDNVPVQQEPEISIWPGWFRRLPYLPIRIAMQVETVK